MSLLSQDRQSSLTHSISDELMSRDFVKAPDRDIVFQKVASGISEFLREWHELDSSARNKIQSLKRQVVPGSSEWDLLYRQYFEESYQKLSSLFKKA